MFPPRDGENGVAEIEGLVVKADAKGAENQESWGVPPEFPIAVLGAMETMFYPWYRGCLFLFIFDNLTSEGKYAVSFTTIFPQVSFPSSIPISIPHRGKESNYR